MSETTLATWLAPFVDATRHVLQTMLGCDSQVSAAVPVTDGAHRHAVSSVISLQGDLHGGLTFSVSAPAARAILQRMTGIESEDVDELVRDAVGEMANMIAGAGKRHLEPISLRLDIPRVLVDSPADSIPLWPHHHWVSLETDFGCCTLDVGFIQPALTAA